MQNTLNSDSDRKFESGNLILVGMMGSGKTTMGSVLAKHLGKDFVDSDEEIQFRTGVTIPHIFDVEGEAGFRQRETAALEGLVQRNGLEKEQSGSKGVRPLLYSFSAPGAKGSGLYFIVFQRQAKPPITYLFLNLRYPRG